MSITISYDISKLENSVTSAGIKKAGTIVANQVVMDSERYVPQGKTGKLVGSGRTEGAAAVWHTVYAKAHYFGTNGIVTFRKYTVGGTGPKWVEKAEASNMSKWEEIVLKGLNLQ